MSKDKARKAVTDFTTTWLYNSEEDLSYNREGNISLIQQDALKGRRFLKVFYILSMAIAFTAILAGLRFIRNIYPGDGIFFLGIIVGIFAFFISLPGLRKRWITIGNELKNNRVYKLQGIVQYSVSHAGRYTQHYITVDEVTFPISQGIEKAFSENVTYQIYYTPNSKIILSAEKLIPEKLANEQT